MSDLLLGAVMGAVLMGLTVVAAAAIYLAVPRSRIDRDHIDGGWQ